MRFEVHQVLDAIERRLSTDPALVRGVLDLTEVVRYTDLDSTRPANLLRLGMVVDALARHLAEEDAHVYVVAPRTLLSDADLTSNERMRIRSWSDDGLIEVVPDLADRVSEVADLTGVPILTRSRYDRLATLAPTPGAGGAVLIARGSAGTGRLSGSAAAVMSRLWTCPERNCASFGDTSGPINFEDTFAHLRGGTTAGKPRRPGSQPPPRLRAGVPVCPRHDARLTDAGPRPAAQAMSVRVDGVLRHHFVVTAGHPVVIGRSPEEPDSVMLGHWLQDDARSWISRRHLLLDFRGDTLYATDTSTNGTVVKRGSDEVTLHRDQSRALGAGDVLQLYEGVEMARSGHWSTGGSVQPTSVMADAPTIAIRLNGGSRRG